MMIIDDFIKVGEEYIVFDLRYGTVKRVRIIGFGGFVHNIHIRSINEVDNTITTDYLDFCTFTKTKNYVHDMTTCFVRNDVYLTKIIFKKRFKSVFREHTTKKWLGKYKNMLEQLKNLDNN